jgi:alanine racemase
LCITADMPRPICASINCVALSENLASVKQILSQAQLQGHPSQKIWAVVKANAYGHTIEAALVGFADADGLALLDFEEAARARKMGWVKPILMLEGAFDRSDLTVAQSLGLTLVIHEPRQLAWLAEGPLVEPLNVYLKMNTGMNRLGFEPDNYRDAIESLQGLVRAGKVHEITHMTHFACAERTDGLEAPMALFLEAVSGLPGHWSVSNSAATLAHSTAFALRWAPAGTTVWNRPGICLYGGSPLEEQSAADLGLRNAMTLRAQLIGIQQVRAGEGVGYGHTFVAPKDMRIGVVACGYADGYPRHAPTGTPVGIDGTRATLVGRVSMDMITVDLSDHPQAQVGDVVVLWGDGGPTADDVAQCAGTISYELLTAVTARVPRRFINAR